MDLSKEASLVFAVLAEKPPPTSHHHGGVPSMGGHNTVHALKGFRGTGMLMLLAALASTAGCVAAGSHDGLGGAVGSGALGLPWKFPQ